MTLPMVELIAQLLRSAFPADDLTVIEQHDVGGGRGAFSEVGRIVLSDGRSFVAKLPGPNREAAIASGAFDREAIAYDQITPVASVGAPICWAQHRLADQSVAFLLSDLTQHRRVDQLDGLGHDDLLRVVEALGGLHEQWQGRSDRWPSIRHHAPAGFPVEALTRGLPALEERWGDVVDPDPFARLLANRDKALEDFVAVPATLCHGDPRADNLVFEPATDDVVLFDWQQVAIQMGEADLIWLLATSVTPEVRRSSISEAVGRYAEIRGQSSDETAERCRRAAVLPGLAVLLLAQRETGNDRTRAFVAESLRRIAALLTDLDI